VSVTALVYGYVRLSRPDGRRLGRLRRDIAAYCRREGLPLALVFADSGVSDTELMRPGWTALLDVLGQVTVQAVVLPTLDHLSRDPVLRSEMRTQITEAGAMVSVMPSAALRETPQGGVSE
jgi:DNA invertase Pin-like site-specific DNA recombinase